MKVREKDKYQSKRKKGENMTVRDQSSIKKPILGQLIKTKLTLH